MSNPTKFVTIYYALLGKEIIDATNIVNIFKNTLRDNYKATQFPVVVRTNVNIREEEYGTFIVDGPFKNNVAELGESVTSFKWNIEKKDGTNITPEDIGLLRLAVRTEVKPIINALGFGVIKMDIKPYGEPLEGDTKIPPTPELPSATIVLPPIEITANRNLKKGSNLIWWLLGGGTVLYLLSRD
jgi:hypothetical protein